MNGGLIFGVILKTNGTSGITQRQMHYSQHAARAAKLSDCRIKVGAIAVCGKQVLSAGWNSTKSHPRMCVGCATTARMAWRVRALLVWRLSSL